MKAEAPSLSGGGIIRQVVDVGERKALLIERIMQLRLAGDEVGLQRMAKQLWPGIKF